MRINIYILDNVRDAFPLKNRDIKRTAEDILKSEKYRGSGEINIIFCDNKKITQLNRNYLKKNRPTDVIAFSMDEDEIIQDDNIRGEIYISVEQAEIQSKIYKSAFNTEVMRLVVHGMLHLAGWDDSTDDLREQMRHKEDFYLQKSGLI
ncbi:rRNA maturation RNase YbeY [bacterium]|nr:rRNA maturation RNase YbeY [bacterium]